MAAITYPLPHDRRLPVRPPLRLVASPPPRRAAAIYRRRRLVAAVATVAVLVLLTLVLRLAVVGLLAPPAGTGPGATPGGGAGARPTRVHVVRPGDTLWSIARRSGHHGDLRPVVDRLARAAGGSTLQVGQRLVVS